MHDRDMTELDILDWYAAEEEAREIEMQEEEELAKKGRK